MRARRIVLVGMLVVLATCGSSSKNSSGGGNTTTTKAAAPQDTTLATGVTDTTLKLGVALINFDCIKTFTDNIRVNQDQNYKVFIDDINKNQGGIGGRQVTAVYRSFCPINGQQVSALCTQLTEDDKVFAVIGNLYDPSGEVHTCIAKKHKTPIITFTISQAIMDKSPPGMILLPGTNPERTDSVLVKLLKEQNTLQGKKIAVLGGTQNKKQVEGTLVPLLKTLGIPMGTTALLNIGSTGDTTQAQAQLDSFIERWKSEGVTALFLAGDEAASKQFVEKVRSQMPDVTLATDITDTRGFGREEKQAGKKPNPYEGILTTTGPTPAEYAQSENWKYCADIYKAQTGKDSPGPTDVVKFPDGKINDAYGSINDACQIMSLVKQIGDKTGKYLNITNWLNTVNNFGPIVNRGGGQFSSLHSGHYDIDDTFRFVAFDSSIEPGGDWKPLTPLQNEPGS